MRYNFKSKLSNSKFFKKFRKWNKKYRNGSIKNFTGIIPLESTINEPFVLFVNYVPSFFVDAHTIDNFIKIYDIKNNKYRAYTGLKIEDEYKRKFCKFNIANDNKFVVGVQDSNDHFQIRLITANGTEVFQSQILNIKGSDDFFIFTNIYQNSKYNNRAIVALIFYENQFVMHQWARTKNGNVVYTSDKAKSNQFVKQNNVQMSEGHLSMISAISLAGAWDKSTHGLLETSKTLLFPLIHSVACSHKSGFQKTIISSFS